MNNVSNNDEIRLKEIAILLSQIKSESKKDELIGAAKWAAINSQQKGA